MKLINIEEREQNEGDKKQLAIGIDLGTTNSLVAYSEKQKPQILIPQGEAAEIKSIISLDKNQKFQVGKTTNSKTISSFKRLMGKSLHDVDQKLRDYHYEFASSSADTEAVKIRLGAQEITAVEASAEILRALKLRAETVLENEVNKAVITVPAYFDDAARQATMMSAKLAGLDVLRLINEPTAAALAYGLDEAKEGYYAIFDLGGGTFDVSILKMQKGVFRVVATKGDNFLGGDDIDLLIAKYLLKDVANQPETQEILHIARKLKEQLSSADYAEFSGFDLRLERLNKIIQPIIVKAIDIFRSCLADAGLAATDLEEVVLVGGSTRIPLLKHELAEFLGKAPLDNVDPDTVVACGAAVQAETLTNGTGNLLIDIIPLSLSLETMGGIVEKIIPRNSVIPISVSQEFTTHKDGQSALQIHIVQGERELAKDNRSLAFFELEKIPAMKAGEPRIKISFQVDADGILTVNAVEQTTEVSQEVKVKPSYGLSVSQMQEMLQESFKNAKSDMQLRMLNKNFVEIEKLIDNINRVLNDTDFKFEPQTVIEVQKLCVEMSEKSHKYKEQKDFLALEKTQKKLKEHLDNLCVLKISHITSALKGKTIAEINELMHDDAE